jgi:hypothetical protein
MLKPAKLNLAIPGIENDIQTVSSSQTRRNHLKPFGPKSLKSDIAVDAADGISYGSILTSEQYVSAPKELYLHLRAMSAESIKLPGEIPNAKVHITVADFRVNSW